MLIDLGNCIIFGRSQVPQKNLLWWPTSWQSEPRSLNWCWPFPHDVSSRETNNSRVFTACHSRWCGWSCLVLPQCISTHVCKPMGGKLYRKGDFVAAVQQGAEILFKIENFFLVIKLTMSINDLFSVTLFNWLLILVVLFQGILLVILFIFNLLTLVFV